MQRTVLLALGIALGLAISPVAVRDVEAAGPLRLAADATYDVDPDAGRVHVAIKVRATNLKPSTSTTLYFYRDLPFLLQVDARAVRASDAAGALSVTTRSRRFHVEALVHLRSNLYYQQTATFTIRYDLVGGAPRSDTRTRVGRAFAVFGVWAWGDAGRSSVKVTTPKDYDSQVDGDAMKIERTAGGGETLTAAPASPGTFYSIVSAENRAAYASRRLSLPGDIEVVVLSWPEDATWEQTVTETLATGLPELVELIGLDWPVAHDLNVRERSTPSLEGYAGVFFVHDQRIDLSEDLDPSTIVHEAAHAWFNDALFTERWITEGLAEDYAWRVQNAVGSDAGDDPSRPDLEDPGHVVLDDWRFPLVIRDEQTDDRERYGYQASFWVIHGIVERAGVEAMREAFRVAEANQTAYPGAGEPEEVIATDSWRRLLDLVESPDQPTSTEIDGLMRTFVLSGIDLAEMTDRRAAREAYRGLLDAGDGWLPPWYVRAPLGEWRFDVAEARIDEALAALRLRDEVDETAAALDLRADDALRSAFEGASGDLGDVTDLGARQLEALGALGDASATLAVEPDLLTTIGLLGEIPPETPYQAARDAFERGELDAAKASAVAAVAILAGAAVTGEQRVLLASIAAALLVLLLVLAVALRRRRRRRWHATSSALAGAGAADPATREAYATLAADPAASSQDDANPPDLEGGPP